MVSNKGYVTEFSVSFWGWRLQSCLLVLYSQISLGVKMLLSKLQSLWETSSGFTLITQYISTSFPASFPAFNKPSLNIYSLLSSTLVTINTEKDWTWSLPLNMQCRGEMSLLFRKLGYFSFFRVRLFLLFLSVLSSISSRSRTYSRHKKLPWIFLGLETFFLLSLDHQTFFFKILSKYFGAYQMKTHNAFFWSSRPEYF